MSVLEDGRSFPETNLAMPIRRGAFALLLGIALGACSPGLGGVVPGVADQSVTVVTPVPNPTETPTPFQPLLPDTTDPPTPRATFTPTPTFTPIFPWGDYPGPAEPSATDIPPPMPRLPQSPEVMNVLLLGSDERPNTGGYRTDTMLLLSLDAGAGTATMVSIPRDLYVYIPGWRMDRINTADVRGGPEMTALTIRYNFGMEIDHWVRVNFSGFTGAVNTLGGLTVESTGYLTDECGGIYWRYTPGTYQMDGFEALCYVRMRKATGDFDRMRRQQEVVRAFFNKILSLDGLTKIPQLYNQFYSSVRTDLAVEDLLSMVPLAVQLGTDPSRIRQYSVDQSMATFWRVPTSGASVLLPDRDAIRAMLFAAFGGPVPEAAK